MPLNIPPATHFDSVTIGPRWYWRREAMIRLICLVPLAALVYAYSLPTFGDLVIKVFAFVFLFIAVPILYFFYDPKVVARRKWREMSRPGVRSTLCPSCTYQITEHDLDEDDNFRCPECGSKNTFWIADQAWRRVLKLPDNDHSDESAPTS